MSGMRVHDRERLSAMMKLVQLGWGADDPTFRQFFTSSFTPTATREQQEIVGQKIFMLGDEDPTPP